MSRGEPVRDLTQRPVGVVSIAGIDHRNGRGRSRVLRGLQLAQGREGPDHLAHDRIGRIVGVVLQAAAGVVQCEMDGVADVVDQVIVDVGEPVSGVVLEPQVGAVQPDGSV